MAGTPTVGTPDYGSMLSKMNEGLAASANFQTEATTLSLGHQAWSKAVQMVGDGAMTSVHASQPKAQ